VRAHRPNLARGGYSAFAPRIAPLQPGWCEGSRRRFGRSAGLARVVWGFRPDARGPGIQRHGEVATRAQQPPTPLGFSFLHQRPRREGEGADASPPRRAGGRRGRTGTLSTRQGRRLQPPLVGRREGRPRREREPDRSRDIYTVGNAYIATNAFATPLPILEPATTTPSPRREHHRSPLPLSSLLDFFYVWHRRRWGAPSRVHAWLLAFEPQDCHIAIVWSSRAIHAPGPAVAVRGPSVITGLRAERAVQGMLCAAASPRDAPLVTRWPRRAKKARPRVRYAWLWPAHVQRAPCWATGQPSREGRRRGALSSRGDFDPGSPPTRVCTCVKPGVDPCVPLQVEGIDVMP
jgi:hypothetical protein